MRPIEIVTAIDIDAPLTKIWPLLVDWEHLDDWMAEASDFKVISSHREGVGVEAVATIKIGGIKTVDTVRVSVWQPPEVLEIEHLGWVKGRGLIRSHSNKGGTHVDWKETLWPPLGILGAIGLRLLKPLMRRTFERDLKLLKDLAEKKGDR